MGVVARTSLAGFGEMKIGPALVGDKRMFLGCFGIDLFSVLAIRPSLIN